MGNNLGTEMKSKFIKYTPTSNDYSRVRRYLLKMKRKRMSICDHCNEHKNSLEPVTVCLGPEEGDLSEEQWCKDCIEKEKDEGWTVGL